MAQTCHRCGTALAPFGFFAGKRDGRVRYVWACEVHRDDVRQQAIEAARENERETNGRGN